MDQEKLRICVHCGLCLQACPTYTLSQNEAESPRGRVALMRGIAENRIPMTETVLEHLDNCLACRACETACPAGVPYGELIEEARAELYPEIRASSLRERFKHFFMTQILVNPQRLNAFAKLLWVYQRSGLRLVARKSLVLNLFPSWIAEGDSLLPDISWPRARAELQETSAASAAFFKGCIAPIAFPAVEKSATDVLRILGAPVSAPQGQVCCGALLLHAGYREEAKRLARKNIQTFLHRNPAFIVTTAAGCGATLKEYSKLLPDSEEAQIFSRKILDFSEAVQRFGANVTLSPLKLRVAYQDACHLMHAQKITEAPRNTLQAIPGLELLDVPFSSRCCGSAGLYNLTHVENAKALLEEKISNIFSVKPDAVVVGNPGCALQIQMGLKKRGKTLPVFHPAELLQKSLTGNRS